MANDRVPDRLVEVWAAGADGSGICGSGWVIGRTGVLTARHVLDHLFNSDSGDLEVRLGSDLGAGPWYRCELRWDPQRERRPNQPTLDVMLLEVVDRRWVPPASKSPRLTAIGDRPLDECDAIGFPDAEQRPDGVREVEQPTGRLHPAGGGRGSTASFDITSAPPATESLWRGFSGAIVRDAYRRLVGVIVAARKFRGRRRLQACLLVDIARAPGFANSARAVGFEPVVEVVNAPTWRATVEVLAADGAPYQVGQIPDLGMFGVQPPGRELAQSGDPFVTFVRRDLDGLIDEALDDAIAGVRRMVLVLGDSAAGKTRALAEAVRRHRELSSYQLVRPRVDQLSLLTDVGLDLTRSVVWFDDIDTFVNVGMHRAVIDRLLTIPMVVIAATIRRSQLQQLQPSAEVKSSCWGLLNDRRSVRQIELPSQFSHQEKVRAHQRLRDTSALRAIDAGIGLGEWLLFGPELIKRFTIGHPEQQALVWCVADWERWALAGGLESKLARHLWEGYPGVAEISQKCMDGELDDLYQATISWAKKRLNDRPRSPALIQERDQRLFTNEYVFDHFVRQPGRTRFPRHFTEAAVTEAWRQGVTFSHGFTRFEDGGEIVEFFTASRLRAGGEKVEFHSVANDAKAMGRFMRKSGQRDEARRWYEQAAQSGDVKAMLELGDLLEESDLDGARNWYERAAAAGNTVAMLRLGVFRKKDNDLSAARGWYEQAARAGDTDGMYNLGLLLRTIDAAQAVRWWESAAEAGNTNAMVALGMDLRDSGDADGARVMFDRAVGAGNVYGMVNLGALLLDSDPAAARHWWEQAARAGNTDAMLNLGGMARRSNPDVARGWYERAAEAGSAEGMVRLGWEAKDTDPERALQWLRRAAETGDIDAMLKLGALLETSDEDEARRWWEQAAEAGSTEAMCNLGFLLRVRDPQAARRWCQHGADAGNAEAMFRLGALWHGEDLAEANRWWEHAAAAGNTQAMFNLGVLLQDSSDLVGTRRLWERAASAGNSDAMHALWKVLEDSDQHTARRWLEQAAGAGHEVAMVKLGSLLEDANPDAAHRWYLQAAEAGSAEAMVRLGIMLAQHQKDLVGARRWWQRGAKEGRSDAMRNLGVLQHDSGDLDGARWWWERAGEAGDIDAMRGLGQLLSESEPAAARTWYERAAEAGNTAAMVKLALLLLTSYRNPDEARGWMRNAAEAGDAKAMFLLGAMLEECEPEVVPAYRVAVEAGDPNPEGYSAILHGGDRDEARGWYEKAAEAGSIDAMLHLGRLLRANDPDSARHWYQQAAEADNTDAMLELAEMLNTIDRAGARRWNQRAAEAGDTGAMLQLGILLHTTDPSDARRWYQQAADDGNTDAMYYLGVLLHEADPAEACRWYRQAAEAGATDAMVNLGALLHTTNLGEAIRWWEMAADAGNTVAMRNLGAVADASDLNAARRWYEQAAEAGDIEAMLRLQSLLSNDHPEEARQWGDRASKAGRDGSQESKDTT